jgi:hypothetical protein
MEDGAGDVAGQPGQFLVALVLRARFELPRLERRSAGWDMMWRVTRSESAATCRSSGVLR